MNTELDPDIEVYEGSLGYALKATFDENKYKQLIQKEPNLKLPDEGILKAISKLFKRDKIAIHEYNTIEKAILVDNVEGKIKLNLLTKEMINATLSKIKDPNKRKKIQYVYIAGIQILVKSLFREKIDSPIVLSLHDQRFSNPQIGHLGTIEGNLYYTRLMFTSYPRYCISLEDKNFDDTISLHFKLLKDISLKKGNKILSFHISALYSLTNSNFAPIYRNKPYIEIEDEFTELSHSISPLIEEPRIPTNYNLTISEQFLNQGETSSNNDNEMILFKNNTLTRNYSSSRYSFDKQRFPLNKGKIEIHNSEEESGTLTIEAEYFNGEEYINGPNILIDTGASNNHINYDKIKGLTIQTSLTPYQYINFDGKVAECYQKVDIKIMLQGNSIVVPCFADNNMKHNVYHIILGNNFLNNLDYYRIEKDGITIHHKDLKIFCKKIN